METPDCDLGATTGDMPVSSPKHGGRGGRAPQPRPGSANTVAGPPGASLATRLRTFVVSNGGQINTCDEFAKFATQLNAADRTAIKDAQVTGIKKGLQSFVSNHAGMGLQIEAGKGPDAQPVLVAVSITAQKSRGVERGGRAGAPSGGGGGGGGSGGGGERGGGGDRGPRGGEGARGPLEHRVFVRRMPFSTSVHELEAVFAPYGKVTDVYIPKDYYTGKPKGIGFVTFGSQECAKQAVAAAPHRIGSNKLEVVLAQPKGPEASAAAMAAAAAEPATTTKGATKAGAEASDGPPSRQKEDDPGADSPPAPQPSAPHSPEMQLDAQPQTPATEELNPLRSSWQDPLPWRDHLRSSSMEGEAGDEVEPRATIMEVVLHKSGPTARIGLTLASTGDDEPPRIKDIAPGSLAAAIAGLERGMALLSVDGRPIQGHAEGTAALKAATGNVLLTVVQMSGSLPATPTKERLPVAWAPSTALPQPLITDEPPQAVGLPSQIGASPSMAATQLQPQETLPPGLPPSLAPGSRAGGGGGNDTPWGGLGGGGGPCGGLGAFASPFGVSVAESVALGAFSFGAPPPPSETTTGVSPPQPTPSSAAIAPQTQPQAAQQQASAVPDWLTQQTLQLQAQQEAQASQLRQLLAQQHMQLQQQQQQIQPQPPQQPTQPQQPPQPQSSQSAPLQVLQQAQQQQQEAQARLQALQQAQQQQQAAQQQLAQQRAQLQAQQMAIQQQQQQLQLQQMSQQAQMLQQRQQQQQQQQQPPGGGASQQVTNLLQQPNTQVTDLLQIPQQPPPPPQPPPPQPPQPFDATPQQQQQQLLLLQQQQQQQLLEQQRASQQLLQQQQQQMMSDAAEVVLYKSDPTARIGLTLMSQSENEPPRIKSIAPGSLAAAPVAGALWAGMTLLSVNDEAVFGHEQATAIIRGTEVGELRLMVQRPRPAMMPPGLHG